MNETENTRIVEDGYHFFKEGKLKGLLGIFTDDIKWTVPMIENAPFAGSRSGKDAVMEFFGELAEAEDITRFEPLEFIAQGDKVVVRGESKATVRSTGNDYETAWVHIFHLKDGKVAEFEEFFDNAAATRAFQKAATA